MLFHPVFGQDDSGARAITPAEKMVEFEIDKFLAKPEPEFGWELISERSIAGGKMMHVSLTSQRWQDTLWQHALMVYQPPKVVHEHQMLLFVTGGAIGRMPGERDVEMGMAMANLCGARVAVLHQVPNQPLMGGKVEDDLITETWLKYLDSGDPSWPLLFPMVKSAVKAMDAMEQLAQSKQWPVPGGFVVSGASKRGWTSWLTAATDSRIKATAPMVIDMLNFNQQIPHQYAAWGKPSEQIIDYTSKGLVREDGKPRPGLETRLWEMMDPFNYRQRVTMPKLLIVGASDRYWTTDAMNLYWHDLSGDKFIFRGANAGHGLEGRREEALATLGVFFRHVALEKTMPTLNWEPRLSDDAIGVRVVANQDPKVAKLWSVVAPTLDFRDHRWEPQPMSRVEQAWIGTQKVDNGNRVAVFAELMYEFEGIPYYLSTLAYTK
jgi:PhoPQ-activated pathogenicity-related protein